MTENRGFRPDWISVPGDTIADILKERNIAFHEFASQIGWSVKDVTNLILGIIEITPETAQKLQSALGASVEFWLARERQYRNDLKKHESGEYFLDDLPIKDMVKFGWIQPYSDQKELLTKCLNFFQVPDIKTWLLKYRDEIESTAFRTSSTFNSRTGAVAAWLKQGEIKAQTIKCEDWDSQKLAENLPKMRGLSRTADPNNFITELTKLCAKCGIAVVVLQTPSGCRASGVTRFLSPNKVMLLLSFRYLSDDHFWFTFFHEIGHILLHTKIKFFLDEEGTLHSSKDEKEADTFAASVLIPAEFKQELSNLGLNGRNVMRFARRIGISPGIVVGQLQHLGLIRKNQLNNLKKRYAWVNNGQSFTLEIVGKH